jgi:hypothetical protein
VKPPVIVVNPVIAAARATERPLVSIVKLFDTVNLATEAVCNIISFAPEELRVIAAVDEMPIVPDVAANVILSAVIETSAPHVKLIFETLSIVTVPFEFMSNEPHVISCSPNDDKDIPFAVDVITIGSSVSIVIIPVALMSNAALFICDMPELVRTI